MPTPPESVDDAAAEPTSISSEERKLRAENVQLRSALNFYRVAMFAVVILLLILYYPVWFS